MVYVHNMIIDNRKEIFVVDKPSHLRDERIDSVKFCLIFSVIAGHVFSNGLFKDSQTCDVIWHWIYIFHMPLFIFISGYFSRKKDFKGFLTSCISLIEPLVIIQIIMACLSIYSTGEFHIVKLPTPWWVLWYLLSLVFWRAILQFLPSKILDNAKLVVITTIIIGLVVGFLPFNRFLSLQRTFAFLPFFFVGYYMKGKSLYLPSKYRIYCIAFLIVSFAVPLFFSEYLGDLRMGDPYSSIFGLCSRMLDYGLSIPYSIAFINACPSNKFFSKQGKYTMQYYIFHALILTCLFVVARKFGLPSNTIMASAYTLFTTLCIWIGLHIPNVDKLTNPSKFFK